MSFFWEKLPVDCFPAIIDARGGKIIERILGNLVKTTA
jgi:hypothetical protein